MIPAFRPDGYLPEGLHKATEAEVTFRFGSATAQRRWLALRLRRWTELARQVGATRLLVDGSFVTAKPDPKDVDAVILLPDDFDDKLQGGDAAAFELDRIMLFRQPEELFGAKSAARWDDWVEFFSRTREADGRRKGLVEVTP